MPNMRSVRADPLRARFLKIERDIAALRLRAPSSYTSEEIDTLINGLQLQLDALGVRVDALEAAPGGGGGELIIGDGPPTSLTLPPKRTYYDRTSIGDLYFASESVGGTYEVIIVTGTKSEPLTEEVEP